MGRIFRHGDLLGLGSASLLLASCGGGGGPTSVAPPWVQPPANLVATAVDPTHVRLARQDNTDLEYYYEVQRATGNDPEVYAGIASLASDTESYDDEGVEEDTLYHYRVYALGPGTDSNHSNVASVRTPKVAPPTSPTGLTAEHISAATIRVTWSDELDNEDGYETPDYPAQGNKVLTGSAWFARPPRPF